MNKHLIVVIFTAALVGCGGGPSDRQMGDAFEVAIKEELTQQIEGLVAFTGNRRAPGRMGLPDPDSASVSDLKSEEMRRLENGDYSAKVIFVRKIGRESERIQGRATFTRLEGKWLLTEFEDL